MTYSEYFDLLGFLAVFPHGLLVCELNDAARFLGISGFWLEMLFIFVNVVDIESFYRIEQACKDRVEECLAQGLNCIDVVTLLYKQSMEFDQRNRQLLKIVPESMFKKDSLVVLGSDLLKEVMSEVGEEDDLIIFKSLLKTLNYYRSLSHSMLIKIKKMTGFQENIVESSSLSQSAFWQDNEISFTKSDSYVFENNLLNNEISDVLGFHETNIRVLLTQRDAFSVLGGVNYVLQNRDYLQTYLNLIEDFITRFLTILLTDEEKKEEGENQNLKETLTHVREILNDAANLEIRMAKLDVKVELLHLAYICKKLSAKRSNYLGKQKSDDLEYQFKTVENRLSYLEPEEQR